MNSLRVLSVLACILVPLCSFAQNPIPKHVEFGSVSAEEVAMKSFRADTNAEAVSLSDYGVSQLADDMGMVFLHEERIKILTKGGFDWGTVRLTLYTADHEEAMLKIEGATYTLAPDGTVKKTPLDEDAVFKEEYDNIHTRYTFTLPALEPGCVVEYRTLVHQKQILEPPEWEFQKSIPVVWSECRILFPRNMSYTSLSSGYEHFDVSERFDQVQYFGDKALAFVGKSPHLCKGIRYVLRNAPAVREEPFITTMADYVQRASFQLSEYVDPTSHSIRKVLGTWDEVLKSLLDQDGVGKAVDDTKAVKRATERALNGAVDKKERVRRVYDVVRSTVEWDGKHRWSAAKSVDEVLESRSGSSAEITVLLVSMLRVADVEAFPVILSTRGNGRLRTMYPIVSQFNYTLACAVVDGKKIFLDATDRFRPMELLPPEVLNTTCLLIRQGPVEWADLTTGAAFDERYTGIFRLGTAGEVDGQFAMTERDYASVRLNKRLKDGKVAEKMRTEIGADKTMLTVDSVVVVIPDSSAEVVSVTGTVNSQSYAQTVGDNLYVNPVVVGRMFENPLTRPTRRYPIDLAYRRQTTWETRLVLPAGYVVKELPVDKSASALDDAYFKRTCAVRGDTIVMAAQFSLTKPLYDAEAYGRLKEFYAQVTSMQSDQIVVQKKPAPVEVKPDASTKAAAGGKKGKKK